MHNLTVDHHYKSHPQVREEFAGFIRSMPSTEPAVFLMSKVLCVFCFKIYIPEGRKGRECKVQNKSHRAFDVRNISGLVLYIGGASATVHVHQCAQKLFPCPSVKDYAIYHLESPPQCYYAWNFISSEQLASSFAQKPL